MAVDFSKLKFFVEGIADAVFLRDLLTLLYREFTKAELQELIIDCKGFNNLKNQVDEFRQTEAGRKRFGGKNIVVFDADYDGNGLHHGYSAKLNYLKTQKEALSIDFESFLFPDNRNDGTVETLLESCIKPEHKAVLGCWNLVEDCVKELKTYTIPANKSKIYFYLECLHGKTSSEKDKIKDRNRMFTDAKIWEFNFADNLALCELKLFLENQTNEYHV